MPSPSFLRSGRLVFAVLFLYWAVLICQAFPVSTSHARSLSHKTVAPSTSRSPWTPDLSYPPLGTTYGGQKDLRLNAASPLFAGSSVLGVIPKFTNLALAAVLSFFRLFAKDMRSLTTRQSAWWVASLATAYALGRVPPFWTRYTSVLDIPRSLYGKTLWGRAVSVSDGDTIRFLHQPFGHPKALRKGQKVSEFGLPVRICTIDTPETPKFGKPGQPFGLEAKEALKALLGTKKIGMRLLQTDQYSRAVAQVFVPSKLLGRPVMVDEYMLNQGLAEVYTGGGAVYGPLGLDGYTNLQESAAQKKTGIWSQKKRETAAEYKRRTK